MYDSSSQADRGGRKGGRGPSESSRDVIFLGLDPELSESDARLFNVPANKLISLQFIGYLKAEHKAFVESAKIVRDKVTGASKCFGFAQFSTIEDAEEFIRIKYVSNIQILRP